jgi:hypothetical protein
VVVVDTLKCTAEASAASHCWVRQFPSISGSMELLSFFLTEDTYLKKMQRICLQVIVATFTPVKFIALYGCFGKPTVLRKFVLKAIRIIS